MTSIAVLNKRTIIERLQQGDMLKTIAHDLGVSPAAISQQLAHDPEYMLAREENTERKLEACEEELMAAPDMLNLTRANHRFKLVAWRAEREHRNRWGAQPNIAIQLNNGASMTDADLERIARRTVEGGE